MKVKKWNDVSYIKCILRVHSSHRNKEKAKHSLKQQGQFSANKWDKFCFPFFSLFFFVDFFFKYLVAGRTLRKLAELMWGEMEVILKGRVEAVPHGLISPASDFLLPSWVFHPENCWLTLIPECSWEEKTVYNMHPWIKPLSIAREFSYPGTADQAAVRSVSFTINEIWHWHWWGAMSLPNHSTLCPSSGLRLPQILVQLLVSVRIAGYKNPVRLV